MKWVITALVLILIGLQYKLWIENTGIRQTMQLEQQINAQNRYNQKLTERNRALTAEVYDLKHGHAAIEERARDELGMIKQGETFYQIVGDDAASKPTREDD